MPTGVHCDSKYNFFYKKKVILSVHQERSLLPSVDDSLNSLSILTKYDKH